MRSNYLLLDLPSTPFKPEIDINQFFKFDFDTQEHIDVENNITSFFTLVNQQVKTFLSETKLYPVQVLVIRQKPGYDEQKPHIDTNGSTFTFSLNWVFCSGDCTYNWYERLENSPLETTKNDVGLPYVKFSYDELRLVESTHHKGPLILNTQKIHNARALDPSVPRLAISFRFVNRLSGMEELSTRISKFVKPQDK